jgi:hypothetical protein
VRRLCKSFGVKGLIWLVHVVHSVGGEDVESASCLVTSSPEGGFALNPLWFDTHS